MSEPLFWPKNIEQEEDQEILKLRFEGLCSDYDLTSCVRELKDGKFAGKWAGFVSNTQRVARQPTMRPWWQSDVVVSDTERAVMENLGRLVEKAVQGGELWL